MALLIFLKQPDRAIAVEGNNETLVKELEPLFNEQSAFLLKTIKGDPVLIPTDNISYIEEITEKEMKRRKEAFEKKQKQQQQQQGKLTIPTMSFPKNRN